MHFASYRRTMTAGIHVRVRGAQARLRRPVPWLLAFGLWLAAMFTASSFAVPETAPRLEIPHLDKVFHFGWFACGGIILASALRFLKPAHAPRLSYGLVLPIVILSLLGALDEFRQSFTPGRTGNDPGDWLADTLGGAFGVIMAHRIHRRRLRGTPDESRPSEGRHPAKVKSANPPSLPVEDSQPASGKES